MGDAINLARKLYNTRFTGRIEKNLTNQPAKKNLKALSIDFQYDTLEEFKQKLSAYISALVEKLVIPVMVDEKMTFEYTNSQIQSEWFRLENHCCVYKLNRAQKFDLELPIDILTLPILKTWELEGAEKRYICVWKYGLNIVSNGHFKLFMLYQKSLQVTDRSGAPAQSEVELMMQNSSSIVIMPT